MNRATDLFCHTTDKHISRSTGLNKTELMRKVISTLLHVIIPASVSTAYFKCTVKISMFRFFKSQIKLELYLIGDLIYKKKGKFEYICVATVMTDLDKSGSNLKRKSYSSST